MASVRVVCFFAIQHVATQPVDIDLLTLAGSPKLFRCRLFMVHADQILRGCQGRVPVVSGPRMEPVQVSGDLSLQERLLLCFLHSTLRRLASSQLRCFALLQTGSARRREDAHQV